MSRNFNLKDYEKQNSADPDVMRSVISEVVSQYPADSYGLVLWSHGTAWLPSDYQNKLKAFGQDGNNWMEIDDLAKGCRTTYLILSCSMPAIWQASNVHMSLETKQNIS